MKLISLPLQKCIQKLYATKTKDLRYINILDFNKLLSDCCSPLDNLPFTKCMTCCFPCDFLTSFYCDVTIAQIFDGPFDYDVIMEKSTNKWDVGSLKRCKYCIEQFNN